MTGVFGNCDSLDCETVKTAKQVAQILNNFLHVLDFLKKFMENLFFVSFMPIEI